MKFFKELFRRNRKPENYTHTQEQKPHSQVKYPQAHSPEHTPTTHHQELELHLQNIFQQASSETVAALHAFLINQEHFSAQGYPDFLTRIFSAYAYELGQPNGSTILETTFSTSFIDKITTNTQGALNPQINPITLASVNQLIHSDRIADAANAFELMVKYSEKSNDLGHIFPTGIQTQFELSDHPITHGSIVSQTFSGIDFYQEDPRTISVPQIITTSLLFFDAKLTHTWEQELYRRGAASVNIKLDGSIEVTETNGNKTKYRRFATLEKKQIPSLLEIQQAPTVRANGLGTINLEQETDQDNFYYVFIDYERHLPRTRQERTSQRKQPHGYTQSELIPIKKRT